MTKQAFYDQLKTKAIEGWSKHQILPSIAIAQAAHESNYGRSVLATEANNLFGIKHNVKEEGLAYFKKTWEVIDGKKIEPVAAFKAFKNKSDGLDSYYQVFHGAEWRKEYYAAVIGESNYKRAAAALQGTYATDPAYADKIIKRIEADELYKYDIEAGAVKEQEAAPSSSEPKEESNEPQIEPKAEPHGKPDFYIEGIPVYKDFLSSSLPNYSGYFMNPEAIVSHETENYSKGADAFMHNRYLHNGAGGRSAAWHFTVDDKCIFWHIPLNRNGWHAGDGATGFGNRKTIGIEHCENSDGDFKQTIRHGNALIRWIRKELNKQMPVHPHKKYSSYGKNCPGNILENWDAYIKAIDAAAENVPVPNVPVPHETHEGEEYRGNSIVDYLISIDEPYSFAARKKLAEKYNVYDYTGTALQNMQLLDKMRDGEPSRIDDKKVHDLETIAQEVIDGKWKNYPERKRLLEAAGYSYSKVQAEVERIIKEESILPDSYDPIEKGDKVILNSSAKKYTTGQDIPTKYKNKEYSIRDVSKDGEKVLLKEITSWVRKTDVTKK